MIARIRRWLTDQSKAHGVSVRSLAVPSLLEVIARVHELPQGDGFTPGPTIFARRPWTCSAGALVLAGDDVPDGVVTDSGHEYLLEVHLALDVIEVWSAWRHDATPTVEQATNAVIYYAEHDAYEPLE
jgi:hypothetical protein